MNEEMEAMGESEAELVQQLKVTQGEVVQWRHDTMPYGAWRRGVAEIWDHEAQCWYVRDTEGFLVRVAPADENILPSKDGLPLTATEQIAALRLQVSTCEAALKVARSNGQAAHDSLCLAEKGHAEAQDMLESLRDELQTLKLDQAALTDTFNEVNAAHSKVNADHHKAQEDLAKLKQELASVTYARDVAVTLMTKRQAEHDAACENARKLGDELQALRGQLASVQAAESEECARLRAVIKDISEMCSTHVRSLMFTKREAARQERRADAWQIAAQDALSQLEEIRAIRNGDELCSKG